MHSKVQRTTHRAWEAVALVVGFLLMLHGLLILFSFTLSPFFFLFTLFEIGAGLGTILVDSWFLAHT